MKETIINLLKETSRTGIIELIDAMEEGGFFEAPCSSDKHLSKEGGLAEHSANVYQTMLTLWQRILFLITMEKNIIRIKQMFM